MSTTFEDDGVDLLITALHKKLTPEHQAKFAGLPTPKKREVALKMHDIVHQESLEEGVTTIRGVLSRFQYQRGAASESGVTTWTHPSGHTVRTGDIRKLGGGKSARGSGWAAQAKNGGRHVGTDPQGLNAILQKHHHRAFHEGDLTESRVTLQPYLRDFKSKKEVEDHLHADGDFILNDLRSRWDGKPINKSQAIKAGYRTAEIRYGNNRKVHVVQLTEESVTADNADRVIESFLSDRNLDIDDSGRSKRRDSSGRDKLAELGTLHKAGIRAHMNRAADVERKAQATLSLAGERARKNIQASGERMTSRVRGEANEQVVTADNADRVVEAFITMAEAKKRGDGIARIPDSHSGYYPDGYGSEIHHVDARDIASQWHGGQASALYALSSTGHVDRDTEFEIAKVKADVKKNPHMYPEDDPDDADSEGYDNYTQLDRLHNYVKARLKAGHQGRLGG